VKAGQIVKVKVLTADARTKRISLSIKALLEPAAPRGGGQRPAPATGSAQARPNPQKPGQQAPPMRAKTPPVPPPPATMNDKIAALTARFQKR